MGFCLYEPASENVTRLRAKDVEGRSVSGIKNQDENEEGEQEKGATAARKMQEAGDKDFRMCRCSRCTRSPGLRFCSRCRGWNKPRFPGAHLFMVFGTYRRGPLIDWEYLHPL